MAHKVIDGKVVVDWTTGDPEGDRICLLRAYRDFLAEVKATAEAGGDVMGVFSKWQVGLEGQIDDVPRIWIERPLEKT